METTSKGLEDSLDRVFHQIDDAPGTTEDQGDAANDSSRDEPRAQVTAFGPFGQSFPLVVGLLLASGGVLLSFLAQASILDWSVLERLNSIGVSPAVLFLSGILLTVLALGQRIAAARQSGYVATLVGDELDRLHEVLAKEQRKSDDHSVGARVVEQVHMSLRKVEGMIANLTKATKLHNRPLVDIVRRSEEIAAHVSTLEKSIDAQAVELSTSSGSVEEVRLDLRGIEKAIAEGLSSFEKKWEGLVGLLRNNETAFANSTAEVLETMRRELEILRASVERLATRPITVSAASAAPVHAAQPAAAEPVQTVQPAQAVHEGERPVPATSSTTESGDGKKVLSAIERLRRFRGG